MNKIGSEIIKSKGYNFVSDLENEKLKFDIITLWDVAEHLLDPVSTFKLIYKKMNKGAVLVIGTARIDDFVDKTSFGYSMWADPPAHTILYNKNVIMDILKSCEFKDVCIDNKHTIGNLYNHKYSMIKRLIKKAIYINLTDRNNIRGDFGSYMVIISRKER